MALGDGAISHSSQFKSQVSLFSFTNLNFFNTVGILISTFFKNNVLPEIPNKKPCSLWSRVKLVFKRRLKNVGMVSSWVTSRLKKLLNHGVKICSKAAQNKKKRFLLKSSRLVPYQHKSLSSQTSFKQHALKLWSQNQTPPSS